MRWFRFILKQSNFSSTKSSPYFKYFVIIVLKSLNSLKIDILAEKYKYHVVYYILFSYNKIRYNIILKVKIKMKIYFIIYINTLINNQ